MVEYSVALKERLSEGDKMIIEDFTCIFGGRKGARSGFSVCIVTIYKGKGDNYEYSNGRKISLLRFGSLCWY